jgi:methionyl-tRNA formyltransferase
MIRTIVLGKGTLAIRIAEWFLLSDAHELVRVVPVIPEPAWTESLAGWARDNGVPWVESGDYREIAELADETWRPDLVFSVFYDKIIRETFIERCGRILNLHNGPLPRYRGVSPINWALKNQEQLHGATIHEITPGIDDGPIVAQVSYSIYPELDEVIDVYERALAYGWTLFEQTIPMLDRIEARPQDERNATYFSHAEDSLLAERRGFTKAFSPDREREAEAAANPC